MESTDYIDILVKTVGVLSLAINALFIIIRKQSKDEVKYLRSKLDEAHKFFMDLKKNQKIIKLLLIS